MAIKNNGTFTYINFNVYLFKYVSKSSVKKNCDFNVKVIAFNRIYNYKEKNFDV